MKNNPYEQAAKLVESYIGSQYSLGHIASDIRTLNIPAHANRQKQRAVIDKMRAINDLAETASTPAEWERIWEEVALLQLLCIEQNHAERTL
jgi:hypothetical protein